MQLYREQLMDHYRNPRNKGRLKAADFSSARYNPSCGDSVSFEGAVQAKTLHAVAFDGFGCVISQATASLISEAVKGKPLADVMQLGEEFVRELLPMALGPVRFKCALLPLQALQGGVTQYLGAQQQERCDAQSSEVVARD